MFKTNLISQVQGDSCHDRRPGPRGLRAQPRRVDPAPGEPALPVARTDPEADRPGQQGHRQGARGSVRGYPLAPTHRRLDLNSILRSVSTQYAVQGPNTYHRNAGRLSIRRSEWRRECVSLNKGRGC